MVKRRVSSVLPVSMGKSSLYRGVTLFRPTGKWRAQVRSYDQIRDFQLPFCCHEACCTAMPMHRPGIAQAHIVAEMQHQPTSNPSREGSLAWYTRLGWATMPEGPKSTNCDVGSDA